MVFVGALVGLFVLQGIRGVGWAGWLLVAVAAAVGTAAALAYLRLAGARLVLTVLAPAPLLFLALFLLNSDASRLTFTGTDNALAAGERAQVPVLLVAFDELPVNSLLDAHGRIDAARFPNFAALAAGSTWFANTSTVAEGTTHAVPAILTGRFPRADEFPVYTDHRQNLFTLVGGASDLHVVDDETHLCPPKLCPGLEGSFSGRMRGLAEDTGVVYLHQLLPDDLTGGIPSIANGWDNFLRDASSHRDPGKLDPAFVESLRPGRRDSLWYVHFMLPHSPWAYLPSGRRYSIRQAPGWGPDEIWNGNQAAVDQYWQRHLLQLGYADRVLGRLVARLRRTGLYDRALVVVTADHGISFRAGQKRRPLSDANLQDIAYVPLFVKLPHQKRGRIEGAPARTIDIVPTIADAIGVRIPWHVDGHSLLGPRPPERRRRARQGRRQAFRRPRARARSTTRASTTPPAAAVRLRRADLEPLRRRSRARTRESLDRGTPVAGADRPDRPLERPGAGEWARTEERPGHRRRGRQDHRRGLAGRRRPLLGARPPIPPGSWNPEDLSTGARSVSAPGAAATGRARRVPARRPRNERAPQLSGEAPLPLLTLYSGPRKAPSLVGGTPLVRGMIPRMGDSFLSL